ncbi:BTB/POZ and MATH domain-containing protein 3-like [Triticum urartu]|nr:BTB/POZ and MATH domain-containing protein 3-like [Triticum urartu]
MSKRGRTTGLVARTTVVDSASLEFTVNYEQTKHLAIGKSVHSDYISAGGHDWKIHCYPRGWVKANNGRYLSIYLYCREPVTTVRAIFKANVMGRHGKPSPIAATSSVFVYSSKDDILWHGWSRFVKRVDLEAKCVIEGRVTFLCHILVMRDDPIPVPPPKIGSHLNSLINGMDIYGTDVSFTTNGETFHAHRAVLAARSPVFRAKFFGPEAGATSSNIVLDDIEPATFKVLLKFMYTDALPGDDRVGRSPPIETFHHLLAAADKYALHRLKLICARKLGENVSLDSIATTLDLAETNSCLELKTKCIDLLAADKDFNKVVLTESFVLLGQKFPALIAELRERVEA